MIIMVMADNHGIHEGQVFEFAWGRRVALQPFHVDGRAAVFEDGVEEHAQARGELDVVACVAEPGGAEGGGGGAGWVEGWGADGDGGGSGVWDVVFAGEFAPVGEGKVLACTVYSSRLLKNKKE